MADSKRFELLEFDHTPLPENSGSGSFSPSADSRPEGAAGAKQDSARVEAFFGSENTHGTLGGKGAKLAFNAGTQMIESGNKVRRKRRDKFELLPNARDAALDGAAQIAKENRRNEQGMKLSALVASSRGGIAFSTPDGKFLVDADKNPIGGYPTETAWGHVGERIATVGGLAKGLASYLPNADNKLRPLLVSTEIDRACNNPRIVGGTELKPVTVGDKFKKTKISLGIREFNGKTQVYRVAGPRYTPIEPHKILPAIAKALPRDWKGQFEYDGEAWSFEAFSQSQMSVPGYVGELFALGLRIFGDDVRRGSFFGEGLARREECLNGNVLTNMKKMFARRHVGTLSLTAIEDLVSQGIKEIQTAFGDYLDRWSEARRERIIDDKSHDPESVFTALVDAGLVDLPGTKEECIQRLYVAWQVEPGYSRADITNAITRAAHESDWWHDLNARRECEEQAAKLLFVKNLQGKIDHAIETRREIEFA